MKFLANENFPGPAVHALRKSGMDVAWVAEDMRAATDRAVLARAQADERIVLTFDKDFGELAYRAGLQATCGIVLFRLTGKSPDEDNARVLAALTSDKRWSGHFSVIQPDRIRMRPLPGIALEQERFPR